MCVHIFSVFIAVYELKKYMLTKLTKYLQKIYFLANSDLKANEIEIFSIMYDFLYIRIKISFFLNIVHFNRKSSELFWYN